MVVLNSLPCTEKLLNLAYEVKVSELDRVCAAYGCARILLQETMSNLLYESGMHLGACNQAVEFLIVAVDKDEMTSSLEQAIRNSILHSGIYYANVLGEDPVYKQAFK